MHRNIGQIDHAEAGYAYMLNLAHANVCTLLMVINHPFRH